MSERDGSGDEAEAEVPTEGESESGPVDEEAPGHEDAAASGSITSTLEPARSGARRVAIAALVLVVVFAAGVALWPLILPSLGVSPPASPWPGATVIEERIAALEDRGAESDRVMGAIHGEIAALANRLAELDARFAAAPAEGARLAGLRDEVAGLEQELGALDQRLIDLEARPATAGTDTADAAGTVPEAMSKRLAALERAFGVAAEEIAEAQDLRAETEALGRRAAALDDRLAALATRLAAVEQAKPAGAGHAAALVVAVGQLRQALRGSEPYPGALAAVRALAEDDPALEAPLALLAPGAAGGVATAGELRRRFAALAGAIVRAGAGETKSDWLDSALDRLSGLVRVRRVGDVAGGGAEARVARAEAGLAAGELAKAVAEVQGLEGAAAEVAANWLAAARARLAAEAAVTVLDERALAALAGTGADAP